MPQNHHLSLFKKELARLIKSHSLQLEEAQILETLQDYAKALADDLARKPARQSPGLAADSVPLFRDEGRQSSPLGAPSTDGEAHPGADRRAALMAELKARRARRHPRAGAQMRSGHPANSAAPGAAVIRNHKRTQGPVDPNKAPELFAQVRAAHRIPGSTNLASFRAESAGMLFTRRFDFALDINSMPLSIEEQLLLDFDLRETRSFDALTGSSYLREPQASAALAAMNHIGLIRRQLPGLSEAQSSSGNELRKETIRRIEATEYRLENYDAFGIFALHWTTYDAEIGRRYKLLQRFFHRLNQPMGIEAEYGARLRAIREGLLPTYQALIDLRTRQGLRQEKISPKILRETAQALEVLAETALRQNSFRRALDAYQRLLELDPDHPTANSLLPSLISQVSFQ